jgi:Tfp pilus assembly protein PilF
MELAVAEVQRGGKGRPLMEAAVADLTRAIDLDPAGTDAWCNRAAARFALRDFAGAEEDWTQAVRMDPSLAEELKPLIEKAREAKK